MRKSIFYLSAVATMAFVSCAQDETIEINQGKDIRFNVLTNSMTRAADVTIGNLSSFKVKTLQGTLKSGSKLVWEDTYTSVKGASNTGDGKDFKGSATHYWPADDTHLHFFAYNESALSKGIVSIDDKGQKISDVTPAAEANKQQDLIVAYATGSETMNSNGTVPVAINFKHVLTKVVIQGKNTNPGLKVDVLGVRLNGVNSKATLTWPASTSEATTLTNTIWSAHNNTSDKKGDYKALPSKLSTSTQPFTLTDSPRSIMDIDASAGNSAFMVLPQDLTAWVPGSDVNGAYISVLCQISQASGNQSINNGWTQIFPNPDTHKDKFAWTAVAIDESWQPGTCYTYTLDFSKGAGTTDPDQPDKGTDPEVPVDPNKPVLGSEISISVSVSKWTDSAISQSM